jgi:hypothetical protein
MNEQPPTTVPQTHFGVSQAQITEITANRAARVYPDG